MLLLYEALSVILKFTVNSFINFFQNKTSLGCSLPSSQLLWCLLWYSSTTCPQHFNSSQLPHDTLSTLPVFCMSLSSIASSRTFAQSQWISIPMQALPLQPTTTLPLSTHIHVSVQRSTKNIHLRRLYRLARWCRLRNTFPKLRHQKNCHWTELWAGLIRFIFPTTSSWKITLQLPM